MTLTTKFTLFFLTMAMSLHAFAQEATTTVVTIPYMEREGLHREYSNKLLKLALEASKEKYGSYKIIQQEKQTVIRRQLQELEKGENLSVAISMPTPEWLYKARVVQFPIARGLASYRLFFALEKNLPAFNHIESLNTLKTLKIGQGPGWSTAKILEDNGFQVVYAGDYQTLFPMLNADRFQLLMRGVYEIGPELDAYKPSIPELRIVEGFAVYTYLPMYFFVSRKDSVLADRLEYGLKQAHKSGQMDSLFNRYFSGTLQLLNLDQRRIFYLRNTNIDASFYERDKPYLLESINKLEARQSSAR